MSATVADGLPVSRGTQGAEVRPTTLADWITSGGWLTPGLRGLPLAPGPLGEALSLVRDPDVDGRRLTRLVARDQVLTARVLRLANVAASAPMHDVISGEQAVIRLGTGAVRRAVLAACFASWVQPSGRSAAESRASIDHALGAAALCRQVALLMRGDPDEAFVHGLLDDIGKLFLCKLREEWVRLGRVAPTAAEEAELVVAHHAEAGGIALQYWGLPVSVREPVRWHHEPASAPQHARAAGVTYLANRLAHRYGFGCQPEADDALLSDPVFASFHAGPPWLAEMDRHAIAIADELAQHLP